MKEKTRARERERACQEATGLQGEINPQVEEAER